MRPDDVRRWLQARKFRPFRMHLSNSTSFDIQHPLQASVTRSTVWVEVPVAPGEEGTDLMRSVSVALLHITHLEPLPPTGTPSSDGVA